MTKTEIIKFLWHLLDEIDTAGDMAKENDALYRQLAEDQQKRRWETGIKIAEDGQELQIPQDSIEIHGDLICTFDTFNTWVNRAKSWLSGIPHDERLICLASNGMACNNGKDFGYARDNDLFPVKAYLIQRVTDKPQKS